jgi:ferredoxin-NADP reductase
MKLIDDFLNYITMYRLVLYVLIAYVGYAVLLSFFGFLPFSPYLLLLSTSIVMLVGWATNIVFAHVFEASANVESVYISALILVLIIAPMRAVSDFPFLFWVTVITMSSKFILAVNKKHIFNPVAIAVFITSLTMNQSANWWVGTTVMLPIISIGGFLIVRKIKRFDLVGVFVLVSFITMGLQNMFRGISILTTVQKIILDSSLIFFSTVMLTEPLTTPPTDSLRMYYGTIVGFLFAPFIHIGSIYSTPEIALLIGNIFSYVVSPKEKLLLTLKEKIQIAPNIYDFIFLLNKPARYEAGQYMEWTLDHSKPDSRGNRRYFTLASSPSEEVIRVGIRFNPEGSSYKKSLLALPEGSKVLAGQLAGDFTLPRDAGIKLVFIAGGIGVTPFRSMVKYLIDTHATRSIVLLFANKTPSEIVYKDVFDEAARTIGMKIIYALTDEKQIPDGWQGYVGRIQEDLIRSEIPDYIERVFYLSGPNSLVTSYKNMLLAMGVHRDHIKTDFFPGFV